MPRFERYVALALLATLASCDRLRAHRTSDTSGDAGRVSDAPQRDRITVGDRTLVIEVRSRVWSEGAIVSGGRLPNLQRPGTRRSITTTIAGSVGSGGLVTIAVASSRQAWDRDLSSAERSAMDASGVEIEHCADPAMPARVAFRALARGGGPVPGGDLRWIGAFLLPNSVSIARDAVVASRCVDALAALPRTAEAWLRSELAAGRNEPAGAAPLRRMRVATRSPADDEIAIESPTGPRSVCAAGIVATTERIALDAALDWALSASDALPLSVYSKLSAALSSDTALAQRALDALDPASGAARLGDMRAPIVSLLSGVAPAVAAPRVASIANSLASVCSDPTRASALCGPTRVEAVARTAERVDSRAACTTIATAIAVMATTLPAGEGRGLARLLALRAVHRCAEPSAARAAALSLLGAPYDYVSGAAIEQTCLSSSVVDRERCMDPALYAAIRLRSACGDDVLRAVFAAAPVAQSSLQRRALLCLARACGGTVAAQRATELLVVEPTGERPASPARDCWSAAPTDEDAAVATALRVRNSRS
ncbi:MAG: hypothetical protein Q8Q09_17170 [Deltaproteobacteria bacterium]|nr:hypothetical protein [Deltaproteobacteria bacterium]